VIAALLLALPAAVMAQDDGWQRVRRSDNAHIRVAGDYTVPAGTTLTGALLVIGGNAFLQGMVEDDVTVIGGDIHVGPQAVIAGDLHSVGGSVFADPAARVTGDIDQMTVRAGGMDLPGRIGAAGSRFWVWLAAWLTVLRLSLVFVAGILLALVAPAWLRSVSRQASEAPGWSFAAGLAAEILATPALVALCIALVITIVGIPLLLLVPVVIGVLMLLWIAGFTAVAIKVGNVLRGSQAERPALDYLIGFVTLCGVSLFAQMLSLGPGWFAWVALPLGGLGIAIEYIAWTLGLGAALLLLFNRQRGFVPPPLPPRAGDEPVSAPA
jgi:hypothetical protein